jgi:MFS family permease
VEIGAYLTAAFHLTGLVASSTMGRLSDRTGRRRVLVAMALTSTLCSFVFGWLVGGPVALVFAVGAIYGFTALGDSPVLSTAFTEAVRPAYLGSGLALRSLLGFGAGAIAPLAFGRVLDLTNPPGVTPTHWGWAFVSLGLGGAAATWCAWGLPRGRPGCLDRARRAAYNAAVFTSHHDNPGGAHGIHHPSRAAAGRRRARRRGRSRPVAGRGPDHPEA